MVEPKKLAPFVIINFVDAISYMVVSPSIVFYVKQVGGTNAQYGYCLSIFSFAAFAGKPFLGMWSDAPSPWGSFRAPYLFSISCGVLGGLLYFFASVFYAPEWSVWFVFVGRLLGGLGGANSVLAFAYIAKVLPHDQQTRANITLSVTRILGMAIGPAFNVFLAQIHGTYSLLGYRDVPIDNLNSVGLVVTAANVVTFFVVLLFLEEPPTEDPSSKQHAAAATASSSSPASLSWKEKRSCAYRAVASAKILVPILCIFSFNAAFQVIETAFPPAANHSLGWGPIQASAVLGGTSIVITLAMMVVFYLSARGVSDEKLLIFGFVVDGVGSLLIYFYWVAGAESWHFYVPIVVTCLAFPFMAAPNRSVYTHAVASDPSLEDKQGFMQALLGMSASLAGFLTPSFVALFVLRDPSTIYSSPGHRELTSVALFAPFLCLVSLAGVLYVWHNKEEEEESSPANNNNESDGDVEASETTGLVPAPTRESSSSSAVRRRQSSIMMKQQIVDPAVQAHRRSSVQMMGGIVAWDKQTEDGEE